MNVIWKLKLTGAEQEFDAPAGAHALKATVQAMGDGQQPVLYLLADRQAPPCKHRIRVVATAQSFDFDDGEQYIDTITVQGPSGPFVLHILHKQLGIIKTS